jgi:hypothetical protein
MCHLQELYAKYQAKGLVVLGFDASDDKKIALEMLGENGVTFPNILDSSDAATRVCFQQYQGSAVPMNYIIDRDGKVVDAWYGGGREHPKAMIALQKLGGELAEAIREEMKAKTAKAAPEVTRAAQRLFQAIRAADYDRDWISTKDWEHFPAKDVDYTVDRNYPGWVRWVCRKFKAHPITDVRVGNVFAGPDGAPTVHFELHLKGGEVLQGDLPFHWDSERKQWIGWQGLDWHLHPPPGKETKKP